MSRNVVTGSVDVKNMEIHSSNESSTDKIIEIAQQIWKEVKQSGVKADDDDGNEKLLKTLREKHQDFAVSFPIPFRWIVQAREFSVSAFEKYLHRHVKGMYKDRKEFLAAQAEYLVLLYRERNKKAGVKQIGKYRESVNKSLQHDDKVFMDAKDEADVEVKKIDAAADYDRRVRLVSFLNRSAGILN
jgi:hypothetical protein